MRKLLVVLAAAAAACGSSGSKADNQQQTVAAPAFSVAGGTYAAPQSVAITCATAGAAIHYTTDGTTPTASSPTYSAAIAVATTTTIKAMATLSGYTDSAVSSATYTLQAATPVFSPVAGTYATPQSVALTTATPAAAIHYTTDGSTPTASSPAYSAPIAVAAATTTIKAIATHSGFADSPVASATYLINPDVTPTATPTFSPAPGSYASAQSVTIACSTPGATIYYTTDGSNPTPTSTVYSAPIAVSATTTIKASATAPGFSASAIASAAYTITAPQQAAAPTFSPLSGTYTSAQSVAISCSTPGATIYYTTDGSAPTTGSAVYSTPIAVSTSMTIRAFATAPGFTPSGIAASAYTISSGGTDFTTLCAAAKTSSSNLLTTCLHLNPAVATALEGALGFPCAEIARHFPSLLTYDPIQGQACAAGFQAMTCADLTGQGDTKAPAACDAAIVGKVAAGGTCYDSLDCAAGFCSVDFTLTCPGTCQAFATLGQGCASAECAAGLVCDAGTCAAAGGPGASCPCDGTLYCDVSAGAPGICRSRQTAGTCDPVADGQCATGYVCVDHDPTAAKDFQCTAVVGAGGNCALDPGLCGLGYLCTSGTCVSWPTVGQSCAGLPLCAGSWCNTATHTCEALKGLGQSCISRLDCASGNCNTATHQCTLGYCVMP